MANDLDVEKLVADANNIGKDYFETIDDIDETLLKAFKVVADEGMLKYKNNPWILGVQIINHFKELGKPNVRNHLEKLVDKGKLESGLFKTRKIYRLRIVSE